MASISPNFATFSPHDGETNPYSMNLSFRRDESEVWVVNLLRGEQQMLAPFIKLGNH